MKAYTLEIWRLRYFWLSLVKIDLNTRYRRSALGLGWSLLQNILMTIVLSVVFGTLFQLDIAFYAPFILIGLAYWGFLSSCVLMGATSLYNAEPYMKQHKVPVAIYPLRTVLGASFHFSIALVVAFVATLFFQGPEHLLAWPVTLMGFLLLFLFGWSLAVLTAFSNVYFPDVSHLLEVGMQIAFYATPIIYPLSMLEARGVGFLVTINPFSYHLELIRKPVLEGTLPDVTIILGAVGLTVLSAIFAIITLWKREDQIVLEL
ncbi:Transport permease protein [Planctomycetales bacterium 10988]|nr:Transport permease protein [Planctomycetales bacterium 10988]